MRRGEIYRIARPDGDPKRFRFFVVVSRPTLIVSRFSSVICAPVYSQHDGLATQVLVGINEGLKYESSVHCDALMSIPKVRLTNFVGMLDPHKMLALDKALAIALHLDVHARH